MRLGQTEVFLIQLITFTSIYLIDSYVGFLVCLITGCIALAILLLSLIFELVEKSKVPKAYYLYILNIVIAAFCVLLIFTIFVQGSMNWTQE